MKYFTADTHIDHEKAMGFPGRRGMSLHHLSFNKVIDGTRFVILDKLEVAILEDIYG